MPLPVVDSATLMCSFGTSSGSLTVIPTAQVTMEDSDAATTMDYAPNVNIPSFGQCTTLSNPVVASATSAASGVLTPQKCVPVTSAPWVPGAVTLTIGGNTALTNTSTCMCSYGGVITVVDAATTTETVT